MDWIVFGDDWGVHPSTTQHLVLNLPASDRVIWINSIGMRSPELNKNDLLRVVKKAGDIFKSGEGANFSSLYEPVPEILEIKQLKILPFHSSSPVQEINRQFVTRQFSSMASRYGLSDARLLSSTPVTSLYTESIPHEKLAYIRLDLYEQYPGCDPELVRNTENAMFDNADCIFVTADDLNPESKYMDKTVYLPQGVQLENFADVSLDPGGNRVLGFFGTLSEWLDYDLIIELAEMKPDWKFQYIGKVDYIPSTLNSITNIELIPAVSFAELSAYMDSWSAAWIPFSVNELTLAVNPLKIREYLAAGLPSISTPLPEVVKLGEIVEIASAAGQVSTWLDRIHETDSSSARQGRRDSVRSHSWKNRALQMRQAVE